MKLLLTKVREALRSSLWFWPAVASVLAFFAARLLVRVDRGIDQARDSWFLFGGQVESARELLSVIASSVMTFTALVFSITILVLQLASGQFSPRVLRTFLSDRVTHVAMATFVATLVFALALLPEVRAAGGDDAFVPALSLFVAFAMVLLSIGVFINYINHMAHAVRAVTIIKRVAAETRAATEQMYPADVLESAVPELAAPARPPDRIFCREGRAGVVSNVDPDALLAIACEAHAVIEVLPRPGDFVPSGAPLMRIWAGNGVKDDSLRRAVLIADERTPHQDPAFGFRQLVDIAERALSPGVNDPSTAVQVLDELHDLLRDLSRRCFPSTHRRDEHGELRLILPSADWESYVRLALDEIRQYGGRSLQVVRRMRYLIEDCFDTAKQHHRAALEEQRRLLDEAILRDFPSEAERAAARMPSAQGNGALDRRGLRA